MMLKQLRTLALLAVCLFAIVIVMGGCGGDDDDDEVYPPPPPPPPKEKTFKEQLVEGSWRVTVDEEGDKIDATAQWTADGFGAEFGIPGLKGRVSQNRIRFENSGEATWTFGIEISDPADPAVAFELIFTFSGSYFLREDSGESAIMTATFPNIDVQFKIDGEVIEAADLGLDPGEFDSLGTLLDDERAVINGNQLLLGDMIAERN